LQDQTFSWVLSVFGGLLSFIAIFVALETFFIQDWLGSAGRAQAAYKEIEGLPKPLTANEQRALSNGQHKMEEAIDFFPGLMVAFLTIVSLVAIVVAASFYWKSSEFVDITYLFWFGIMMLSLLAVVVVTLGTYSFYQLGQLKNGLEKLKTLEENETK
jgi:hypothetical protein